MSRKRFRFTSVTRFSPGTPFVEAFGLLTASLLFDGKDSMRRITLVGAQGGHGVTTTALNLALTMAGAGRRTLLVDANLRAPVLHDPFNVPQSPGVAEVLTQKVAFKDAVRASKTSNLYLLPAGTVSSSPTALLQHGALEALFEHALAGYDLVVVDTPPVLRYPDALHIARFTDGVLVVLPGDGAPRRAELELRRRLERVDANILGIVLNKTNPRQAVG